MGIELREYFIMEVKMKQMLYVVSLVVLCVMVCGCGSYQWMAVRVQQQKSRLPIENVKVEAGMRSLAGGGRLGRAVIRQ